MCELLVAGLPLKSDGVESQKVNDMLVRMAEVRRDAGQGSVGQQGRAGMQSCCPSHLMMRQVVIWLRH